MSEVRQITTLFRVGPPAAVRWPVVEVEG